MRSACPQARRAWALAWALVLVLALETALEAEWSLESMEDLAPADSLMTAVLLAEAWALETDWAKRLRSFAQTPEPQIQRERRGFRRKFRC